MLYANVINTDKTKPAVIKLNRVADTAGFLVA